MTDHVPGQMHGGAICDVLVCIVPAGYVPCKYYQYLHTGQPQSFAATFSQNGPQEHGRMTYGFYALNCVCGCGQ
jgi:hypothetical protein